MRVQLCNAFSLNMLSNEQEVLLKIRKVSLEEVKSLLASASSIESAIGHMSTARVLSILLGQEVPMNRVEVKLNDQLLVIFQLKTRLEEGKILSESEILNLPFDFYVVEKCK